MNSTTALESECPQVPRLIEEPHQTLWELCSRVVAMEHNLAVALAAGLRRELTRQWANRRRGARQALADCF